MVRRLGRMAAGALAAWLCIGGPGAGAARAAPADAGSPTLAAVRARGQLRCGIAGTVPGFSLPDGAGVMRGLDADQCRALASAIFGDPGRAAFVRVTNQTRFTALQSGEVDVLFRQTSWTLAREAGMGLLFGPPYFYDGTGFMVRTGGVRAARELGGATICLQPGTSTELAVTDFFGRAGLRFRAVEMDDLGQLQGAFLAGRCDAYATDRSALATFRHALGPRAGGYAILPELASKEPLAAAVRKGDDKWFDLVRWTAYAQLAAEEAGLTGADVDAPPGPVSPEIRRLLGEDGALGEALGVDRRWAYHVVKSMGNAAEMWDRNVAPLGVPRGLARLWDRGGIQFPPPLR